MKEDFRRSAFQASFSLRGWSLEELHFAPESLKLMITKN
jgi:hypothetical protein